MHSHGRSRRHMWSVTEAHLIGWDAVKLPIVCNHLCVLMKPELAHLPKSAFALLLENV